ncbi:MAG TPA: alpha/beta hydrolase [Anaerolineales bacterium]|nr:alpha/beta hydrolase [Anaerolineales bacterium]
MKKGTIHTRMGVKLAYQDNEIATTSVPIMFVHGFPMDHRVWDLTTLPDRRELRVDLPGFGESDIPPVSGSMKIYADALLDLLDELKIEKTILCAHSMGGYACLQFLADYPNRISGLILAGSQTAADSKDKKKAREQTIQQLHEFGIGAVIGMADILAAHGEHRDFFAQMIQAQSKDGAIFGMQAMIGRLDHSGTLITAAIPKMIVHGELDNLVPLANYGDVLMDPAIQVIQLPEVGHSPMVEAPEKFNQILRDWLN